MLNSIPTFRTLLALTILVSASAATATNDPVIAPRERIETPDGLIAESPEQNLIEGFTEPYADINMAAAEMGTLASVSVKDGDEVRAGQLIANLDDAVLKASLEVARAGMTATGDMKTATTQMELRKVELNKLTALFGRNHASQQELDQVRGEVQLAEARIQTVREDLEIRRLEYARIEAQLRQRQIRSTIDGVVVDVRKDHGEFVSPSDPVVARIVQLDPLLVVFSVPNDRRHNVRRGDSAKMQIGTNTSPATGLIEHVSPTADASSGTFKVKIRLPNPSRKWHGGEKSILLLDGARPTSPPTEQIAKNFK